MNDLFANHAAIITRYTFRPETGPGLKVVERYEIVFIDASRLLTYESRKGSKEARKQVQVQLPVDECR